MPLNNECERAMAFTIPAVRIAVSRSLKRNHKMSETRIAKALGIAQAAVSKYIGGSYSRQVDALVKRIESMGLEKPIVDSIIKKNDIGYVSGLIDKTASNTTLVKYALSL